jgi:hypothetical protein
MWVRTKSTVAMIGGFIFFIYMGHVPLTFLIFAIQVPRGCMQHDQQIPSAAAPVSHLTISWNQVATCNWMHSTLQATMCRELFKLARDGQQQQHHRRPRPRPNAVLGTRFQQWSFFCIAAFWMYLRWGHAVAYIILWAEPSCCSGRFSFGPIAACLPLQCTPANFAEESEAHGRLQLFR